jgi:hypothetical protein
LSLHDRHNCVAAVPQQRIHVVVDNAVTKSLIPQDTISYSAVVEVIAKETVANTVTKSFIPQDTISYSDVVEDIQETFRIPRDMVPSPRRISARLQNKGLGFERMFSQGKRGGVGGGACLGCMFANVPQQGPCYCLAHFTNVPQQGPCYCLAHFTICHTYSRKDQRRASPLDIANVSHSHCGPTIELCKRATHTRTEPKDPQDVEESSPEGQRCDTDGFKAPRRRSMGRRTKSQSSDVAVQSPENGKGLEPGTSGLAGHSLDNGKGLEPGTSGLAVQSPDNGLEPIASGLSAQSAENVLNERPSVV